MCSCSHAGKASVQLCHSPCEKPAWCSGVRVEQEEGSWDAGRSEWLLAHHLSRARVFWWVEFVVTVTWVICLYMFTCLGSWVYSSLVPFLYHLWYLITSSMQIWRWTRKAWKILNMSNVQVCHQRLSSAFGLLLILHCSLIQTLTLTWPPNNALLANMDMWVKYHVHRG